MIILPLSATPSPTSNPPTPSFTDLHGSTNVLTNLLGREGPECADVSRYRTTTNIVLSCLTTILACTWVALHLDTTKSHQSVWKYFWRRFGWMILALIAPEFIAAWAIRDRLEAKKYMDAWNKNFASLCDPKIVTIRGKTSEQYARELEDKKYDSRWTLTHGFLARMGGIRLYSPGELKDKKHDWIRRHWFISDMVGIRLDDIFGPEDEKSRPDSEIFEDPKIQFIIQQIGLISCDDIQDKSKGDWMTKFIVVIQTTWFIIQCLSRWAIHLPVTELEVVTLAYAVQNIIIYFLWWNKPQSLSVPFRLYFEKDSEQIPEELAAKSASEQEMPLLSHSPNEYSVDEGPNSPLPGSETRHTSSRRGRRRSLLLNEQLTHSGTRGFFMRLFTGDRQLLFFALAGTIFGALHLIPLWLSTFPSDTEQKMWQVSAFYVTVGPLGIPIAVLVVAWVTDNALRCCCRDSRDAADKEVAKTFALCTSIATCAVARVILLVLAFTTLRFLPKEAFRSVEWTRFIPHF